MRYRDIYLQFGLKSTQNEYHLEIYDFFEGNADIYCVDNVFVYEKICIEHGQSLTRILGGIKKKLG